MLRQTFLSVKTNTATANGRRLTDKAVERCLRAAAGRGRPGVRDPGTGNRPPGLHNDGPMESITSGAAQEGYALQCPVPALPRALP
jgi:hypothetical protein